jgi:uncharacterized protein YlxW (UPF0749 family)
MIAHLVPVLPKENKKIEPTYADLQEEIRALQDKVAKFVREKRAGRGSEQVYRALLEQAGYADI